MQQISDVAGDQPNKINALLQRILSQGAGKGDIDTFRLLHPGMELLSAFGEIAGSLIDATVKNANESRTLAQTRDLLLPRLMSGELRVADAETLASEVA